VEIKFTIEDNKEAIKKQRKEFRDSDENRERLLSKAREDILSDDEKNYLINIVGQYLKTNEEIGYVVLDVDTKLSKRALELLKEVKDTIKVRMLY
jgi:hypothetical protein